MSPIAFTTRQSYWCGPTILKEFRSGVSLHSHTMFSEESLEMVPRWIFGSSKNEPCLQPENGFWTPPLTARQAYRLEQKQIEKQFQLPGQVSITDHDDIRAGNLLRVLNRFCEAPISTEWTVPFGPTFFHFGVHNLRLSRSAAVMTELREFTAQPDVNKLAGVLSMLNGDENVLIVINHPLWDEKGIGRAQHAYVLHELLQRFRHHIHALEANGLRSWKENERLFRLASYLDLPVVAGGDRHGLEPNAIVNLSRGTTMEEFVEEVRYRRFSHLVFMPQYRRSRRLRITRMIIDIIREYPDMEGRRSWRERVFYRHPETGETRPLSSLPAGRTAKLMEHVMAAVRFVDRRSPSAILTSA